MRWIFHFSADDLLSLPWAASSLFAQRLLQLEEVGGGHGHDGDDYGGDDHDGDDHDGDDHDHVI